MREKQYIRNGFNLNDMDLMKHFLVTLVLCLAVTGLGAQSYKQVNDIPYSVKTDKYARERRKLDVYYPEGEKDCPVIVWFHGGGLEAGERRFPTG